MVVRQSVCLTLIFDYFSSFGTEEIQWRSEGAGGTVVPRRRVKGAQNR